MKKLFVFLPAFVLTSMNLMGAAEQPTPMEVGGYEVNEVCNFALCVFPTEIKLRIIGNLGDNPNAITSLAQVCEEWDLLSQYMREVIDDMADGFSVDALNYKNLSDYKKVIARCKKICDVRRHYFGGNFKEVEFIALQNFIIKALFNEMAKPEVQVNLNDYIFEPLSILGSYFLLITSSYPKGIEGSNPLCVAAQKGCLPAVKALVFAGADVNYARNPNGFTPLHLAAYFGQIKVVEFLLSCRGIDANKLTKIYKINPLYYAAKFGHDAVVELLIRVGHCDVNVSNVQDGSTPLYLSASSGNFNAVVSLLRAGADHEKQCITCDANGMIYPKTPLYTAAANGYYRIVEILLLQGADFEKGCNGWTPLFIAKTNNHIAVAHLIEEAMARRDSRKRSAADRAVEDEPASKRQRKS